jgi:RecA/RadA recombinase
MKKRLQDKPISEPIQVKNLSESTSKILIPTGNILLNLACSDHYYGGYGSGKIVNLIGDSSTGKTLLALSMMAEIALNKTFDNYQLIYDDVEAALEMDIQKMFGKNLSNRLVIQSSDTIEDVYGFLVRTIQEKQPFIYVLDSLDALSSQDEQKRSDEYAKEKEVGGSYKTEKARMISEMLRVIVRDIKTTDSLVLVISQTRDNLGYGSMFSPKVRSGGKALKFYCTHEIWLTVGKKIKVKEREIGSMVQAKISKNKLTGKRREVEFPIYTEYGVDSIAANISFLIENNYWKKSGSSIEAPDFDFKGTMNALIKLIETDGFERKLDEITGTVWEQIEDSIKIDRKSKYD